MDNNNNLEKAAPEVIGDKATGNDRVIIYTVREGDTLWDIANRYGVALNDLKRWNKRRNNIIRPGDELKIITTRNE